MRHAKAESATLQFSDEDRALTPKGVDDAKKLATKLVKKDIEFDLILTSPAIRAITSAQIIANRLDQKQSLRVEKKLYQADSTTLLAIVGKLHKKIKSILLVGHNPELEDFAAYMTGESVSMQTCSLIEFTFELKDWKDFEKVRSVQMKLLN